MKQRSQNLIKTLLVSAVMSILTNHSEAKVVSSIDLDNDEADQLNALKAPVWHNVMKVGSSGNMTGVDSHRSHRSHSSHRSSRSGHSSHSSHYSSSHYSSSHYSSSGSFVSKPAKTYKDYSLGDRTLSHGLYGSDVDALISLLKKCHYLRDSYSTKKNDYGLYSADVEQGVIYFQQDAGLPVTGIMDGKTKEALENWNVTKSKRRLGIRDLKEGDEGEDVTELIRLLIKAGYSPNPQIVGGEETVFSYDVAMALKVFQAFVGLPVTGVADCETIGKLKSMAK